MRRTPSSTHTQLGAVVPIVGQRPLRACQSARASMLARAGGRGACPFSIRGDFESVRRVHTPDIVATNLPTYSGSRRRGQPSVCPSEFDTAVVGRDSGVTLSHDPLPIATPPNIPHPRRGTHAGRPGDTLATPRGHPGDTRATQERTLAQGRIRLSVASLRSL